VAVLGMTGKPMTAFSNLYEIARNTAEIGLLALALTPLLALGAVDLSVGSLAGAAAVALGLVARRTTLPFGAAVGAAMLVGAVGGGINGALVARLRLPSGLVTLGGLALWRGLA